MSHKVHPYAFRLGEIFDWKSRWFSLQNYKNYLKQDIILKEFLKKKLERKAGLEGVEIERTANKIRVIIKAARPGMIIGRGGTGADDLRKEIKDLIRKSGNKESKINISVDIEEIPRSGANAKLIAINIAEQIEKRMPFRRVIKQAITKAALSKDVKGVKISVAGRLNGSEIARTEWLKKGSIPLHTIRANIDYANDTAHCTYGAIGIKVWVYKGEIFKTKN